MPQWHCWAHLTAPGPHEEQRRRGTALRHIHLIDRDVCLTAMQHKKVWGQIPERTQVWGPDPGDARRSAGGLWADLLANKDGIRPFVVFTFMCMLPVVPVEAPLSALQGWRRAPSVLGGCVCTCACIASLLVGFGIRGLLQPGSTGLGCEETLVSEMHQSQTFAAREGEQTHLSPFKITGSKEAIYILNLSSCPTPRTGPFKNLSAALSELNFWPKCSNYWAVTSCSPESYLINIGLCDLKTPIIGS